MLALFSSPTSLCEILMEVFFFCPGLGWGWGMPQPCKGLEEGGTAPHSSWTGAWVPGGCRRMEMRESHTINQPLKGSVDVPEVRGTC